MNAPCLLFLDLGGGEIFVIVLVVLLFFGSKNIPELARGLGKGIREFKDAANGIQQEIKDSANTIKDEVNVTKDIKELKEIKDNFTKDIKNIRK